MMLTDGIVGIADDALGPYPHPQRVRYSQIVAWAVEYGLGDRVAWCSILNELTTVEIVKRKKVLHLADTLAAFKAVHGNRKGKAKRPPRRRS